MTCRRTIVPDGGHHGGINTIIEIGAIDLCPWKTDKGAGGWARAARPCLRERNIISNVIKKEV